mmetsp:Transcript_127981/g.410041  ORF Transcript_127981/g.410041 Transcript_127981/m.410041 type:complete len:225 (-) Transcript_127981:1009-1683(-)
MVSAANYDDELELAAELSTLRAQRMQAAEDVQQHRADCKSGDLHREAVQVHDALLRGIPMVEGAFVKSPAIQGQRLRKRPSRGRKHSSNDGKRHLVGLTCLVHNFHGPLPQSPVHASLQRDVQSGGVQRIITTIVPQTLKELQGQVPPTPTLAGVHGGVHARRGGGPTLASHRRENVKRCHPLLPFGACCDGCRHANQICGWPSIVEQGQCTQPLRCLSTSAYR